MMMTTKMMSPPKHLELIFAQFTFLLLPAQESNQAGIFATKKMRYEQARFL